MALKIIRWIIAFVIIFASWRLAPADPYQPDPKERQETLDHIIALAQEQQQELSAEKTAHTQTQQALDQVRSDFNTYKDHVQGQLDTANAWLAEKPHIMQQVHRAKIIATVLILAVAGMAIWKIGGKIGLGVGATFAPAAITFVWAWL